MDAPKLKIEKVVTVELNTRQVELLKTILSFADEELINAVRQNEAFYKGFSIHQIRELHEFAEALNRI